MQVKREILHAKQRPKGWDVWKLALQCGHVVEARCKRRPSGMRICPTCSKDVNRPWIAPNMVTLDHLQTALHYSARLLLIHGVMAESEGVRVARRINTYMKKRRARAA